MSESRLTALLQELVKLPHETEWVEFKHNRAIAQEIGEYLSALSNAAALYDKPFGYLIFGIEEGTHTITGTTFKPRQMKQGNEDLEPWLLRLLTPRIEFRIREFSHEGKAVVVFEIPAASHQPVRFHGEEFIRCGSYKKKLNDYPEKERSLWSGFSRCPFETGITQENASADEVLSLINYPDYFDQTNQRLPDNRNGILERLEIEKFIIPKAGGHFDITNKGAILFAKDLGDFDLLARKAIRVILYKSNNRTETIREQRGIKGYASGFVGVIRFINDQLPENEQISQALRQKVRMYPEIAVRELVANAIIHQDFTITGTGPMVEIFSDRIEITNPGVPLIDTMRFIDGSTFARREEAE
jgi:ATP-dependent DNA helicase RecG